MPGIVSTSCEHASGVSLRLPADRSASGQERPSWPIEGPEPIRVPTSPARAAASSPVLASRTVPGARSVRTQDTPGRPTPRREDPAPSSTPGSRGEALAREWVCRGKVKLPRHTPQQTISCRGWHERPRGVSVAQFNANQYRQQVQAAQRRYEQAVRRAQQEVDQYNRRLNEALLSFMWVVGGACRRG